MLEIIGIFLALAAALDFALNKKSKIQIANRIERMAVSAPPTDHPGYSYIQRFFGAKLFSRRAILISTLMSLISLVISYLYAVITSDFSLVSIFEHNPSWLSLSFFVLFLMGSLVGDVFSYAQTRVFLKTIDHYRTGVVTIGLALADAVISLALFIFIFSFTRLIAYMAIVAGVSGGQLSSTQAINLDLLRDKLPELVSSGYVSNQEIQWLSFLATAKEDDSSIIDNSLRIYTEEVVGPLGPSGEFSLKAEVLCAPEEAEIITFSDTVEMVSKSAAGARGFGQLDREYENLTRDITKAFASWKVDEQKAEDPNCALRILKIDRLMSPGKLLDIAGPTNTWWATFQMTFQDAYSSIAYKFGPYVSIDPFNDLDRFYESIIFQSGYSFLDLTDADPTIPYLLSEFKYGEPEKIEYMRVPYSPMLASALTVSILFWLYILTVFISRGVGNLSSLYRRVSKSFDVRVAPMTSVALVISVSFIGFESVSLVLRLLWRFIF